MPMPSPPRILSAIMMILSQVLEEERHKGLSTLGLLEMKMERLFWKFYQPLGYVLEVCLLACVFAWLWNVTSIKGGREKKYTILGL